MAINNLGNGNGFIYITDTSGNILSNIVNNIKGRKSVLKDALINATLADDTSAITSDRKYYINTSGTEGSITGATEITNYITSIGLNNRFLVDDAVISSGMITYTRKGSVQRLRIDTEGSAATDNLIYLRETNGYITDGDIVILVGENIARVTSVLDKDSAEASTENGGSAPTGVGYFELDSDTAFDTNTDNFALMLMYNADLDAWYEVNRAPGAVITTDKIRGAGINLPKEGTELITSINAGDSFTPTVDITSGIIHISGTHNLGAGNYTINLPSGGTPREGDEFTVVWESNVTTTGVIDIFATVLNSEDYGSGISATVEIKSRYINGAWKKGVIVKDTKTLAGGKENSLGNPLSSGQFLTSTTAGVRSWSTLNSGLKTKIFTYDFAVHGGAVGQINIPLASDGSPIPNNAIIDASRCIIESEIALASSGEATTIQIGIRPTGQNGGSLSNDIDYFLTSTLFSATPFSLIHSTSFGASNLGKVAEGTALVTVNIGAEDLVSGKFNIIVAYYEL